MSQDMYCVKDKKITPTENVVMKVTKNNRNMMQGKCTICGTTKTKFVAGSSGSGMRTMQMKPEDYDKLAERLKNAQGIDTWQAPGRHPFMNKRAIPRAME
jgi:hypothetical protein